MGEIIVKKIRGMKWGEWLGLVVIFTLFLTALLMHENGRNEPEIKKAYAVSGDVILLWDPANGAIPSGWACASCNAGDPFYGAFPRANSAYNSTLGGADNHTPTLAYSTQTSAAAGASNGIAGTAVASGNHTHASWPAPTAGSSNVDPPFKNLNFIWANNPSAIPNGVIGIFASNTSLPAGWVNYAAMNGLFLRGSLNSTTGGSANHAHTTTAVVSAAFNDITDQGNGATDAANHTHTISAANILEAQNNPPYVEVVFAYNNSGGNVSPITQGLIAFFDAAPPSGWTVFSNANGNFLKGAQNYGATGGGSANHNHTGAVNLTSGAPSTTVNAENLYNGTRGSSSTHTHIVTYTINEQESLPVFRQVILASKDAAGAAANVTASATGTQTANLSEGTTAQYIGAAFRFQQDGGSADTITALTITDIGSANVDTAASNAKLYYQTDQSTCTYSAAAPNTSAVSFASQNAAFGSINIPVTVSAANYTCVYLVFDVDVDTEYNKSIDPRITASADFTLQGGSTKLGTYPVGLTGVTNIADSTAPADVTGLSITPADSQLTLNWTNSSTADYSGVRIRRATGSTPANCASGNQVADVAEPTASYIDSPLTNGTQYYYRLCAYDEVPNYAAGATANAAPAAAALADPPANVTGPSATGGNGSVTINSWTNPACGTNKYEQVVILRNTASIIDRPSDGSTYAVDDWIGASRVVRGSTAFGACNTAPTSFGPNTGLANGQRYYYKIFAASNTPKYSSGAETYATPTGSITSGGTGTLLRRTPYGDNTCGGSGQNACHNVKPHNATNTESQYWSTWGGWGTSSTSGRYGKFTCQTCHQPHSTRNIYLIKQQISFPDNSVMPSGSTWTSVDYRYKSDEAAVESSNYSKGYDISSRTSSWRVCEVCHSRTKHHRYNATGQTSGWSHNNGIDCANCHKHTTGFKKGGKGGADCGDCHSDKANPMKGAGDGVNTYHMVMNNSAINALPGGTGASNKYPNEATPAAASTHRRCLMCHNEMENFDPDLIGATNTPGMAYNLRRSISAAPATQTATNQLANTDFSSQYPGGWGICTSCHLNQQTKNTALQTAADRTIYSPAIDPSSFEKTTHNFTVAATFTDASTFYGNCSKCHTDTMAKGPSWSSTTKFGLHDSELRRLNAPMSLDTTNTPRGADKGTATGFSNTAVVSLTDSGKTWTADAWKGRGITISAGTGSNQTRVIKSNTTTVIEVTSSWSPVIAVGSYYLLGDPIEEELCFRCHSTSTTSNPNYANRSDYYGARSFKNTRAMGMEQVFATTNPYGHRIANYSGLHKVDEAISAPTSATSTGWFTTTRGGPGQHVGCTDCHNPHAARKPGGDAPGDIADAQKGSGQITNFSNTATVNIQDSEKTGWTTNQWRGYVLRIIAGSGAGQDRLIMSNTAGTIQVFTSWETVVGNGAVNNLLVSTAGDINRTYYIISPLGHPQYGNLLSNVNDDIWGVTIGANWPMPATITTGGEYMPTTAIAGTFFTKKAQLVGNSDKIYNLCFKCHSAYGWGTGGTPFTIPDYPGAAVNSYTTGPSADIMARFNPNNLAHHAVYSRGKNQPIKANYGMAAVNSSYNTRWPYWSVGGASNISIASGNATLPSPMPATVLPGWFVWIGSNTATDKPNNNTATLVAGGASWGFLEITSIASLTQFSVTPAVTITGTSVFAITAGFGNNFVPPYGPWSVISCTDCHDTDNSNDPSGPHASARKYILRKMETQDFPWFNGTSIIRKRYVPNSIKTWAATFSEIDNVVCVNCHRADVYGVPKNAPQDHAGPGDDGRNFINMTWAAGAGPLADMARQRHYPDQGNADGYANATYTGIQCMMCHGGGAQFVGTIAIGQLHGTSLGYSKNDAGVIQGSGTGHAYRGKRFLVGGVWSGLKRSSTTAAGYCYTAVSNTGFTTCGNNGEGVFGTGNANYDFESAPDY